MKLTLLLMCLLANLAPAAPQEKAERATAPTASEQPMSADALALVKHSTNMHKGVQMVILGSAEKMPEEHYGFKPAADVRSFGQILGHIVDAHYFFCGAIGGEKGPRVNAEKTLTTKAELTAALKEAFAYCDKVYAGLTAAKAAEIVRNAPPMGADAPRLGLVNINNLHTIEHYGNLVTYMRMKNVVPPSSDPGFMQRFAGPAKPVAAEPKK